MLVLTDGTRIGTISGGCLEADVVRKAWWWTDDGATVRIFDNSDEDAARDFGLGCNGTITVLLERASTEPARELLGFLDAQRRARKPAIVATVVRAASGSRFETGERLLRDGNGEPVGTTTELFDETADAAAATARERWSRLVHLDDADVFVEWIAPPQRVVVFGSGHDVVPLATIARMLGWSLTIADGRASGVDARRFPDAERVFVLPSSGDLSALGITKDDAVVVMSHNYPQDLAVLPQILAASPKYVGLLGPRSRAGKLFAAIGADVGAANVHAPVGLAIGGDQPESIALAIAAEIECVLHGQPGGHLRRTTGSIHAPAVEAGASREHRAWQPEPSMVASCGL
jgi:xanthine/CO dehydrogenase XdhC/CoxF family maturation factor